MFFLKAPLAITTFESYSLKQFIKNFNTRINRIYTYIFIHHNKKEWRKIKLLKIQYSLPTKIHLEKKLMYLLLKHNRKFILKLCSLIQYNINEYRVIPPIRIKDQNLIYNLYSMITMRVLEGLFSRPALESNLYHEKENSQLVQKLFGLVCFSE